MRVIKYKNEKQCSCEQCETIIGYNETDVESSERKEYVCGVKDFLKNITQNDLKQLSSKQLKTLTSHNNWVMFVLYHNEYINCPNCGEIISLGSIFDYMEIYPKQEISEGGEPDNAIVWEF